MNLKFPNGLSVELVGSDMCKIMEACEEQVVIEGLNEPEYSGDAYFTMGSNADIYVFVGMKPDAEFTGDWDVRYDGLIEGCGVACLASAQMQSHKYLAENGVEEVEGWDEQIIHVKISYAADGVNWEVTDG